MWGNGICLVGLTWIIEPRRGHSFPFTSSSLRRHALVTFPSYLQATAIHNIRVFCRDDEIAGPSPNCKRRAQRNVRHKICYERRYGASQKRRRGGFYGDVPRDRNFRVKLAFIGKGTDQKLSWRADEPRWLRDRVPERACHKPAQRHLAGGRKRWRKRLYLTRT